MIPKAPWEDYLRLHFPGYLLPDAAVHALSEGAATRFLEGLGARPSELSLLRIASFFAAHADEVATFAETELPALVRALPERLEPEAMTFEGRVPGLLDVAATLRSRLSGRPTRFTVRAPRSRADRPENALVKDVARRLFGAASALTRSGLTARAGWAARVPACALALEHALRRSPLGAVADVPIDTHHERLARRAVHPAYATAVALRRALRAALEGRSPEQIARVVADGALLPRDDAARFELAVLLALLDALADRLEPAGFTLHRTLVLPGRREVADFTRGDQHLRVHYNQACLEPGPYDAGLRRYLGQTGRLRPDITVTVVAPEIPPRAAVIEAKLSADPSYLAEGYREALLYRTEYAAHLAGWPKAILVASASLPGEPRREDDVIAVGWDRWVPASVIEGLTEGLGAATDVALIYR